MVSVYENSSMIPRSTTNILITRDDGTKKLTVIKWIPIYTLKHFQENEDSVFAMLQPFFADGWKLTSTTTIPNVLNNTSGLYYLTRYFFCKEDTQWVKNAFNKSGKIITLVFCLIPFGDFSQGLWTQLLLPWNLRLVQWPEVQETQIWERQASLQTPSTKNWARQIACRNVPVYTHSSAASARDFHRCKAKEHCTITR